MYVGDARTVTASNVVKRLGRKLMFAISLAKLIALLLAALAIVGYDQWTYRDRAQQELSQKARLLSLNLTAALTFGDKPATAEILSTLRDLPEISEACVYDSTNALFAGFGRAADVHCLTAAPSPAAGFVIGSGQARLSMPVIFNGRNIGWLRMAADLPSLASRLPQYGLALFVVLLALGAGALLLRSVVQRMVVSPILSLVRVARTVAIGGELRPRTEIASDDEIGDLGRSLNQMLDTIDDREGQLSISRNLLQSVIDNTPAAIHAKDLEDRHLVVNRSYAESLNMMPAAVLGRTTVELFPTKVADEIMASDREVLGRGVPMTKEEVGSVGDQTKTYLVVRFPLRDGAGIVHGVGGIATDISERKEAERRIRGQLQHLHLLDHITRAIGERQDLRSIFQVVVGSLEDSLPIDFGCVYLHDPAANTLGVTCVGAKSEALAHEVAMQEGVSIDVGDNGLGRCIQGQLVYEPDIGEAHFPFPERLARGGLGSLVMAPLRSESHVFGLLVAARRAVQGLSLIHI